VKGMCPGLKGLKGSKENTCIAVSISMEGTCMGKMSLLLAVEILQCIFSMPQSEAYTHT